VCKITFCHVDQDLKERLDLVIFSTPAAQNWTLIKQEIFMQCFILYVA